MPAFCARRATIRSTVRTVIRRSSSDDLRPNPFIVEIKSAESISPLDARYAWIANRARSERNTIRTFPPFPRTLNSPVSRLTDSRLSETSSETRNPEEKNVSRSARLRSAVKPFPSAASKRRFNSSGSKKSTCRPGTLANSIRSDTREETPSRTRYLRKLRRTIT